MACSKARPKTVPVATPAVCACRAITLSNRLSTFPHKRLVAPAIALKILPVRNSGMKAFVREPACLATTAMWRWVSPATTYQHKQPAIVATARIIGPAQNPITAGLRLPPIAPVVMASRHRASRRTTFQLGLPTASVVTRSAVGNRATSSTTARLQSLANVPPATTGLLLPQTASLPTTRHMSA
jgi:hypothetical protein